MRLADLSTGSSRESLRRAPEVGSDMGATGARDLQWASATGLVRRYAQVKTYCKLARRTVREWQRADAEGGMSFEFVVLGCQFKGINETLWFSFRRVLTPL